MAIDKNVVEDFLDAIKQPEKKTNATHNATVTRIDETGNVWVQVSGSDKETPTSSTSSEVKRGDAVTVEWRNNKLYIAGNYSNPAAGVTRVANVENDARIANEAARMALTDAQTAQAAAESAQASATIAAGAASDAQTAAESAQSSADSALVGLATVEDVVGVLNWITAHGTMTLTSDVAINPDHVYFVVDPAGDYEVGGTHYSVVAEPDVADIGTYYELSVDESVQNYVVTHLAVNTEGLWIIPDMNGTPTTNGKKILIATGAGSTYTTAGTYIIDRSNGTDTVIASFRADGVQIGAFGENKVRIDPESITFSDAEDTEQFSVKTQGTVVAGTKQVSFATEKGGSTEITLAIPSGTSISYTATVNASYSGTFTVAVGAIVSNAYVEFRVKSTDATKTTFTLASQISNRAAKATITWGANYYKPLISTIGDCGIGGALNIGGSATIGGALSSNNLPCGLTTTQESTSTGSIAATTDSGDKTDTFTKAGYYPLGIVGVNIGGTNRMYANLYEFRLSSQSTGSCTVTYRFRNNASVAVSLTAYFDILWAYVG